MKFFFALPFFLFPVSLFAQNDWHPSDTTTNQTVNFFVNLPHVKIANSLYSTIRFLDERADTANLGFIEPVGMSGTTTVLAQSPLNEQFKQLLHAINDTLAGTGELLGQLNRFTFSSNEGGNGREVYFFLRMRLYAHNEKGYQKPGILDTVVTVAYGSIFKSSFTKRIFASCSTVLANFFSANLTKRPADPVLYSIADVMHIDSIEKQRLPAYTTDKFKNGLYPNFSSFKNQQPETTIKFFIIFKKGKINGLQKKIPYHDENGNAMETTTDIAPETFYAVVYDNTAYIANSYGCYPSEKRDGDFYFTGKIAIEKSANSGVYAAVYFGSSILPGGFGGIGSLIADIVTSGTPKATFEVKIDYLTGGFVPIREIRK
jgi:hypothetical protein